MQRTSVALAARALAAGMFTVLALLATSRADALAQNTSGRTVTSELIARGDGYGRTQGSGRVRTLQRRLTRLGARPGPVDGLFGPRTELAVRRLQQRGGLTRDGIVGPRTATLLARLDARASRPAAARRARRAVAASRGRGRPGTPAASPPARRPAEAGSADGQGTATARGPAQLDALADRSGRAPSGSVRAPVDGGAPFGLPALAIAGSLVLPAVLVLGGLLLPPLGRRHVRERPQESPGQAPGRGRNPSRVPPDGGRAGDAATPVGSATANGSAAARPARRPVTAIEPGAPALGYVSVGDDERFVNGEQYEAQARAIEAFCERRGLRLVQIIRDVAPDNDRLTARPGLHHGVEALARGEARTLVVNDLGRLTRSPGDLGLLLRWLSETGRTLISLDTALDTSTLAGRGAARALIEVGRWDWQRASARRARSSRAPRGRPAVRDVPDLHERIERMRADGMSLQAIADALNAEGVPTLRGGIRWRPSSVQAAVGYKRPRGGGMPRALPPVAAPSEGGAGMTTTGRRAYASSAQRTRRDGSRHPAAEPRPRPSSSSSRSDR